MVWADYERYKNLGWEIETTDDGSATRYGAEAARMMDIREALRILIGIFQCHNMQAVPGLLRRIARQTDKSLKAKAAAKRRQRARARRKR